MTDTESDGPKKNAAMPDSEAIERTGRTEAVTGETDEPPESPGGDIPGKDDLLGPAGDPAEGKRPGGSGYPA